MCGSTERAHRRTRGRALSPKLALFTPERERTLERAPLRSYETRMAAADDEIARNFAKQDKEWTGPKFFGLGFVTLLIALTVIIYFATRTGCTVAIVP